jgi:hypothetical protein
MTIKSESKCGRWGQRLLKCNVMSVLVVSSQTVVMKNIILLLFSCLILISCRKSKDADPRFCNNVQYLDSSAISTKILGKWEWTKTACANSTSAMKVDRQIKVNFLPNNTFVVLENSSLETSGTWKLKVIWGSLWGLDLNPQIDYLQEGQILFCDNYLIINPPYLDVGCTNFFIK